MRFPIRSLLSLSFMALTLGACHTLPQLPDYQATTRQDRDAVAAWERLDDAVPTAWLDQLIDSPQLASLVAEALEANPSLRQTWLQLQMLRQEQIQTGAARLPTLEGGYSGSKEEDSRSSYTGTLTVSWELDLWGRLRDDYQAAVRDVGQEKALFQSARDTLAAEVMETWLQLIADKRAIAIEQRRLATLEKNEKFILQRYRGGLGSLDDLESARTSSASSRASLEEYRENLAELERSLREMLGRTDTRPIEIPDSYPKVGIPLADLPTQTLQRRPDLRAAYLAIEAADLRTSVAYKDLLPSIDLQAALTDVDGSAGSALFSDPVWSLLGQLTAPLFEGGRLRAAAKEAELQAAQVYQEYRETLVTAVKDVRNALGQERSLSRRIAHVRTALTSARNNLAQYQRSYRTGLVDILDLLSVQQNTYDLEARLDNLIYERLQNRIVLGLALGLGAR